MKRAKEDPDTAIMVWWENLPPELDELIRKQFEEAEEREEKRREKRAQARKKKKEERSGTAADNPA